MKTHTNCEESVQKRLDIKVLIHHYFNADYHHIHKDYSLIKSTMHIISVQSQVPFAPKKTP